MTFCSRKLMGALFGAAVSMAAASAQATDIAGAGATFPYPIYAKWAEAYKSQTGNGLNYQSIGSGGGIKQIKAKTVDFGASDKPLEAKELDASDLVQWPMIMGGVVPVVNIPGIAAGQLKLTGALIANIYLGKITKWNDPQIVAINAGLMLPALDIAPVYRSDGSGTTFNFAYYLSAMSPDWKDQVGADTAVQFPTGLGGKGNEGVSAFTSNTVGAIGYVEFAYATKNGLAYTQMQNKDGAFVTPSSKGFAAAAANADWAHAPGMRLILANQPGADSWPITAASFILFHKVQDKPDIAKEALKFFDYSFKNGSKAAGELDYVSLPENVVSIIEANWSGIKDNAGKAIWPLTGS